MTNLKTNLTFRDIDIDKFVLNYKEKYINLYKIIIVIIAFFMSLTLSFLWGDFLIESNNIINNGEANSLIEYIPSIINKSLLSIISYTYILKSFNSINYLKHKLNSYWIWITIFFIFSFSIQFFIFYFKSIEIYFGLIYVLYWFLGSLFLNLIFNFYLYRVNIKENPLFSNNKLYKSYSYITIFSFIFFLIGIFSAFLNEIDKTQIFDINNLAFVNWLLKIDPLNIFIKILSIILLFILLFPWIFYIFKLSPIKKADKYVGFIFSSIFLLGTSIWFIFSWSLGLIENLPPPIFSDIFTNYMVWIFLSINIFSIIIFFVYIFFGKNEIKGSVFRTVLLNVFLSINWFLLLIINLSFDLTNKISTFLFVISIFSTSILFLIYAFQKPKINFFMYIMFSFLILIIDLAILINVFLNIFNQFEDVLSSVGNISSLAYIIIAIISITSTFIVLIQFWIITKKTKYNLEDFNLNFFNKIKESKGVKND